MYYKSAWLSAHFLFWNMFKKIRNMKSFAKNRSLICNLVTHPHLSVNSTS